MEAVWRLRTLGGERDIDWELGRSRWIQGIRSDQMEKMGGQGGRTREGKRQEGSLGVWLKSPSG